jgi:hypothetical protein
LKISVINFSKLRNDAHFQLNTEFKDLITKTGAENLKIKKQFDELFLPAYRNVDEALKKITKSAHTERLQVADVVRDEIFLGMVDVIKGNTRHFEAGVRESARRVKIVTDTYGNVARKPLNEQTSAVYNLLQDLRKLSADLKAIKIDDWVNALEKANLEFDAIVKERFEESAAKTNIVLRDARRGLDNAVKTIFSMVEVFSVAYGAENYVNFVRMLNVIIGKYGGKGGAVKAEYIASTTLSDQDTLGDQNNFEEGDDYDLSQVMEWEERTYQLGDLVRSSDLIWRCIDAGQSHRSPSSPYGYHGWEQVDL